MTACCDVLASKPVLSPARPWVRHNTTLASLSLKSSTQRITQNIQRKKPEDMLFHPARWACCALCSCLGESVRWKKCVVRFITTSKRRLTEQWHSHWNTTCLTLSLALLFLWMTKLVIDSTVSLTQNTGLFVGTHCYFPWAVKLVLTWLLNKN